MSHEAIEEFLKAVRHQVDIAVVRYEVAVFVEFVLVILEVDLAIAFAFPAEADVVSA